jgi:hypothetical protein
MTIQIEYEEYMKLFGSKEHYSILKSIGEGDEYWYCIEFFGIKYFTYVDQFMYFTVTDKKKFTFAYLKHGISFKIIDDE